MHTWNNISSAARLALCAATACALASRGGTLTVQFGSAMEVIEGGVTNSYAKNDTFTPTNIPCVYKMRMGGLAAGGQTFAVTGNDQIHGAYLYRFPQYGDDGWVRVALDPFPADDTTVKLTAYKVSKVYYADAARGNNAWDGTADYEHRDEVLGKGPKQTLQAAHDGAATGSESAGFPVVYVAPGFYSNGVAVATTTSGSNSYSSNRRLVTEKNIAFIATAGAANTFIVGAPDPNAADGFGADAVGGVYMRTTSLPAYLQGFTITGCYSPATQSGIAHYGTAFGASSYRVTCLDCVISNNYAKSCYPAGCYGLYQRTRFIENTSPSYTTYYGTFISCVFAGNRNTSGNGTATANSLQSQAHSFFCTYDLGDADYPDGRRRLNATASINSALIYKMPNPPTDQQAYWHACQVIDDPVFADAAARDYRLGALSPALGANSYETDLSAEMRTVMTGDVDGRTPVLHDGKMCLGAVWNDPPLPVTVIVSTGGGVSATGANTGTNVVSSADPITVTATDLGTRVFAGFEVNGERVSAPDGTYSFTPSLADGAVNSVKALYETDWYVDCVNGNDANPGSASLPKKTIRAATTNAVRGDVIHVAPGTYGALEGSQKLSATTTAGFRVIVPEGVTLIGTAGAEKTLIVGAEATGDLIDNDTYGTGANGVRCVCASNGAVVCGFTLTGGRGVGGNTGNNSSAAFYSPTARGATIEDCIVSNNVAYYRTIYQAVVKRCRVLNNVGLRLNSNGQSDQTGSAGTSCSWYSCIIDGNKGNAVLMTPTHIESCTFGTNQMYPSGSAQVLYNPCPVLNSLFTYASDRFYVYGNGAVHATNCIFRCNTSSALSADNCGNCLFSTAVSLTDYKPASGSLAIDAGSNEAARYDIAHETDILGTPRALNGKIDIGAVEYDWRPTFSLALGKYFQVDYASPSVTTNAAGGLLVPDGAVVGRFVRKGPYELAFAQAGGGLAVSVDGTPAKSSSAAGEQTLLFNVPDASSEVGIAFTPDAEDPGAAVLKGFVARAGFALVFR